MDFLFFFLRGDSIKIIWINIKKDVKIRFRFCKIDFCYGKSLVEIFSKICVFNNY